MSVILDALRRGRRPARPASGTAAPLRPPEIPAGLGVGTSPIKGSGAGGARPRAVALVLPAMIVVVAVAAVIERSHRRGTALPVDATAAAPSPGSPEAMPLNTPPVEPAHVDPIAEATALQESPAGQTADTGAPSQPAVRRRSRPRPVPPAASEPPTVAVASAAVNAAAAEGTPAARRDPLAPVLNDFEVAVRHQALGNYEQALQHYMAALRINEFNVEARNNLGLLYHQRGLTNEAIEQFRRALLIDPQYSKARSNLAVVLTSAGRLAEARTELRAALASEPRNVDLLVNQALVEKADRQPDAAIEVLLEALRVQPRHAVANYNIAVLYEETLSMALAYSHYRTFLTYATPEHSGVVADVQERVSAIAPLLASGSAR